ncbi:MAG: hypothetical protein K0S86_5550, partial [Geminicoccaceae bacterium]|nr:hypothetical protein [Geminicoccaceae bacterium]
ARSAGANGVARSAKGTVVTSSDVAKLQKEFRLLGLVYPFFWIVVRLDALLFGQEGHKLIARYRRVAS